MATRIPLLSISDGTWVALAHLSLESIRISGIEVNLDTPIALLPGQRFVIEWKSYGDPAVIFLEAL